MAITSRLREYPGLRQHQAPLAASFRQHQAFVSVEAKFAAALKCLSGNASANVKHLMHRRRI
jgi:hypothetical protein